MFLEHHMSWPATAGHPGDEGLFRRMTRAGMDGPIKSGHDKSGLERGEDEGGEQRRHADDCPAAEQRRHIAHGAKGTHLVLGF